MTIKDTDMKVISMKAMKDTNIPKNTKNMSRTSNTAQTNTNHTKIKNNRILFL